MKTLINFAKYLTKLLRIEPTQWHRPERTTPERSKYNYRVSDDIIIRDLVTEKEFRGHYDYSRDHYVNSKGNMIWGAFIWRYDS